MLKTDGEAHILLIPFGEWRGRSARERLAVHDGAEGTVGSVPAGTGGLASPLSGLPHVPVRSGFLRAGDPADLLRYPAEPCSARPSAPLGRRPSRDRAGCCV